MVPAPGFSRVVPQFCAKDTLAEKWRFDCLQMGMQSAKPQHITHYFCFHAEPALVYLALTEQRHIRRWWSADATVEDFVGGHLKLGRVPHDCLLVVERLELGQTVEWKCAQARRGCSPGDECVGTRVSFRLSRNDRGGTLVEIHHRGWRHRNACLEAWDLRWTALAGKSLKSYLETGLGRPVS
jgi:uncharacterized protein YndB with AHSA1/START domain